MSMCTHLYSIDTISDNYLCNDNSLIVTTDTSMMASSTPDVIPSTPPGNTVTRCYLCHIRGSYVKQEAPKRSSVQRGGTNI